MLTAIAAIAANGTIGLNGTMPWPKLPEDMRNFKAITMGHPCIMGRKTYDSIGRPLEGRKSIVLTRDNSYTNRLVSTAYSVEYALSLVRGLDAFVIGGAEIYRAFLPHCGRMILTILDASYEGDTVFPEYDVKEWRRISVKVSRSFKTEVWVR
jgi:dihydrofolate reductase